VHTGSRGGGQHPADIWTSRSGARTVEEKQRILRVSELNQQVKRLLESHFSLLWIEGEISNLTRATSGHWYFSLKEDQAQVRCAMFRSRASLLRSEFRNGDSVRVRARVSLYEGRGEFQLIVEHMELAGAGALQAAFEALKAKLTAEGLLAQERKRPLPRVPRRLAVITSPTGAALRDIITVLGRRCPSIAIDILPVPVQGSEAAPAIVAALQRLDRLIEQGQQYDAVIVGRGGGSMEDLWAFNDETVARAILACRVPVVSAVGHEIDFTIADFVADARAPTPSAAAELLSPDSAEQLAALRRDNARLHRAMTRTLEMQRERLRWLRRNLRHPGDRLREQMQRLDDLDRQLLRAMQRRQQQAGQRLGRTAALLNSLSPLATLERGYAIVQREDGQAVRAASECSIGDNLAIRLGRGQLQCAVTGVVGDR